MSVNAFADPDYVSVQNTDDQTAAGDKVYALIPAVAGKRIRILRVEIDDIADIHSGVSDMRIFSDDTTPLIAWRKTNPIVAGETPFKVRLNRITTAAGKTWFLRVNYGVATLRAWYSVED